MVVLALGIGFVVGFLVWAILLLSSALTTLVWGRVWAGQLPWFAPVVICTTGGLAIGLWSKYLGGQPASLEQVMHTVKKNGSYRVENLGTTVVGFLLPLAFGGSVGPEAGLTGLIAAACSWIGTTLRRAGLKVKEVTDLTISAALSAIFGTPLLGIVAAAEEAMPTQPGASGAAASDTGVQAKPGGVGAPAAASSASTQAAAGTNAASAHVDPSARSEGGSASPNDYTFRRSAKIVLYVAAAFGAVAGIAALGALTGSHGGLPRFDTVSATGLDLLWCVPCMVAGYALAFVYHASNTLFSHVGTVLEDMPVVRAIACGVLLGLVGMALPFVLYSGEEQSFELIESWQGMGAMVLLATGALKAAVTPFCLNMGWRGGNGFPTIFAGLSVGFGFALLTGADTMLCVTVVTATTLAGVLRKPLLALAFLFLCFPAGSILWMGLACVIGAALPLPRALAPNSE